MAPPLVDPATSVDPFALQAVAAFVPSYIAPRIVAQKGLFTVHPTPTQEWQPPKRTKVTSTGSFDIKPEDRDEFERRLFQLAVDPSLIRADLDGIGETLAWQFRKRLAVGSFNY